MIPRELTTVQKQRGLTDSELRERAAFEALKLIYGPRYYRPDRPQAGPARPSGARPVRKAKAKGLIAVYNSKSRLLGAVDAADLHKLAKAGDQAMFNAQGQVIGYARSADITPIRSGSGSATATASKPQGGEADALSDGMQPGKTAAPAQVRKAVRTPVSPAPSPRAIAAAKRILQRAAPPSDEVVAKAVRILRRARAQTQPAAAAAPVRKAAAPRSSGAFNAQEAALISRGPEGWRQAVELRRRRLQQAR
jgi:hypothetical protein